MQLIPIDKIRVPERIPSKIRVDALVNSIKKYGLMSPITVKRLANGTYKIVDGASRYWAKRALGHDTIIALILKGK